MIVVLTVEVTELIAVAVTVVMGSVMVVVPAGTFTVVKPPSTVTVGVTVVVTVVVPVMATVEEEAEGESVALVIVDEADPEDVVAGGETDVVAGELAVS